MSLTAVSPPSIPIGSVVDKVIMTGEHLLPYRFAVCIYKEADSYNATCLSSTQCLRPTRAATRTQPTRGYGAPATLRRPLFVHVEFAERSDSSAFDSPTISRL